MAHYVNSTEIFSIQIAMLDYLAVQGTPYVPLVTHMWIH